MAETQFNLNRFLGEQDAYLKKQYTAAETAKAVMEERDIQRAKEAVEAQSFLSLTLQEKLNELGVGKRVVQQIGETAMNMAAGLVSPLTEYLDKYENIFDSKVYHDEIQSLAKQTFFSKIALEKQASAGTYIVGLTKELSDPSSSTGTQFSMNM